MTDSFWTGGSDAYYNGIRVHYQMMLAELNAELADCEDQLERRDIEQEILAVQAELKEKLNGCGRLIF